MNVGHRVLAAAEEAFQVKGRPEGHKLQAGHLRRRMRELSMLVHPDKCSLDGAEAV